MKKFFALLAAAACCVIGCAQRIAVLNDIHISPDSPRDSALRIAVQEINADGFDAVVVNGDLANEGSNAELAYVKAILDQITHPLYVLPGNHEDTWSQSATMEFPRLWGNDRIAGVVGADSLVIIGINCGPYMKMGDGHIKQEDLHWLRSTLDSLCTPGRRVLSFCHYPVRKDDLDNYADYAAALSHYPVIGQIGGHYHQWIRYSTAGLEAAMMRALLMTGDGTFGYAVIEIDPHWVKVYEKLIGESQEPMFAWPAKVAIDPAEASALAQLPPLEVPEGFSVQKMWTDSASVFTRMAFDADRAYFGTSTGIAKAIDKASGALAWQKPVDGSLFGRATVLGRGRVAIPTCQGIAIVNAADGRTIKDYPSASGPYVADGTLAGNTYLQGGYKRFEARNAANGRLKWVLDSIGNYCQAAPAVDGDDAVFGAWDTWLRCVDIPSGRLKWKWNNGRKVNLLGPGNVVPVIAGNKVIIVAPDRYMTAIDRATGATIWRDNSEKYRESLGHSADGRTVYAKTMNGKLVAVDATSPTFRKLWVVDMGLGYEHAPCVIAESGGLVYAGSRRGIVTAVDPATQTVVMQLQLGSSAINGIDIDPADGSVWVSLIEGTIFRIAKE